MRKAFRTGGGQDSATGLGRRRAIGIAGLAAAAALGLRGATPEGLASNRYANTFLGNLTAAPPRHAVMAVLDVPFGSSAVRLLRALVDHTRGLSGAVEVGIGLGASWFDKAGLAASRPVGLVEMPPFPGDVLSDHLVHGDLFLQVGARTVADAREASAMLLGVAGLGSTRWIRQGFRRESHVEDDRPVTRNLFGFVEGFGNPPLADGTSPKDVALVGTEATGPAWVVGGSYLVIRIIRFARRLWDAEPVATQERVIGRRRDGGWLDGTPVTGEPRFVSDPQGQMTPLGAHVRRANPRTPGSEAPRMVRRGYSYVAAADSGQPDDGLLFVALQADLERGFATVQRRLAGQELDRYTLTIGGGYFFLPNFSGGFPLPVTNW